jgi:hypothetical protein
MESMDLLIDYTAALDSALRCYERQTASADGKAD